MTEVYIALAADDTNCDIYYLPNSGNSSTSTMDLSDASLISGNTKYTVTVRGNDLYELSSTVYVREKDSKLYLSLPNLGDGLKWSSEQIEGDSIGTVFSNFGSSTIYIVTVDREIVIEPAAE